MTNTIAVIMGGISAEREVSLVSGATVTEALKKCGYHAYAIDMQRDVASLLRSLQPRPDVIFNALHGRFGEDGCIQGVLNFLSIPYTHSGLLASAVAMDKPMSKRLFDQVGICVAEHQILSREEILAGKVMVPPFVIKPLNDGSSIHVHIIMEANDLPNFWSTEWPYGTHVMVERFVSGKELTVAVMGDTALAVTEIKPATAFYDYHAKYAPGGSFHVVPAELPTKIYDEALRISALAHKSLGCRGVTRADIRFDGEKLYMLEINTQPGMTPTSLVPEQARHVGMTFEDLVIWMVENAVCDL